MAAWQYAGLRPVGHLVFMKSYPSNIAPQFLEYRHEAAYLLAKGKPPQLAQPIGDVLAWGYTGNRHHPTEKPISVLKPLIEAFTAPDDIVLDRFAGSGTTAVAARELGRRYIAIELDAGYAYTARERLLTRNVNGISAIRIRTDTAATGNKSLRWRASGMGSRTQTAWT